MACFDAGGVWIGLGCFGSLRAGYELPMVDELRLQHPADTEQGRALHRRIVRVDKQPAEDACRMVHYKYKGPAACVSADQLLDDRVLFYGDKTVRGRPGRGRCRAQHRLSPGFRLL